MIVKVRSKVFEVDSGKETVGFHGCQGLVDRVDQVAAQGIDEAKLLAFDGGADQFKLFGVLAQVALAGNLIDDDCIHIASDEGLHGEGEGLIRPRSVLRAGK